MEIGNFAMAKGLQCVLALFPRNNRFSESFLALFRAKWAVLRPFPCIWRISTAPATVLAAAAEESPRKMQNSKVQGRTAAPSGSPGNSRLPTWSCPGGRESMHFRRVSRGFSISADPDIYIHSIHISGSAPSVTWSCLSRPCCFAFCFACGP